MDILEILVTFVNERLWLAAFISLLFLSSCQRRPRFPLKAAAGLLALSLISLLPEFLSPEVPWLNQIPFLQNKSFLFWPVLLALYMKALFRCNWNMVLLSAIAGLCMQETVFGLWAVIDVSFPSVHTPLGELLICGAMNTAGAIFLYAFLASRITPRSLQVLQERSLLPLAALYILSAVLISSSSHIVVPAILFFDRIEGGLVSAGAPISAEQLRMNGICVSMAGNALILLSLRNMLRYSESELDRGLLEQIREQDRKQYAHFRDNVDYINLKSHDLKHYLDLLQEQQTIPRPELQQVSQSLKLLDVETDSGNETLDLILTDRRLSCEKAGIKLIFQTDGTKLEQLDVIDTYSIFCNILDNAIEHVEKLEAPRKTIHLGLRTIHNMVFIHQENPFSGTLQIKEGIPITTKDDRQLHGFGLRSVQQTVRRRGGELLIQAQNNKFIVDIYFPAETADRPSPTNSI